MNYDNWKLETPPENNEPKEKEKCDYCLELFDSEDLYTFMVKFKPLLLCSECLNNANQ